MRFLFSFAVCVCCHLVVAAADTYGQQIYVDNIIGEEFEKSLFDLKQYLQIITGKDFVINREVDPHAKGILLIRNKKGLIEEKYYNQLEAGSIEDFVLAGNQDRLLIVATHAKGFSRAIYTYLDYLGVKWYFPGEEWEFVPESSNIIFKKTQLITPSFHQRELFGTGGIRDMSFDASGKVKNSWQNWKRRNRLGSEVELGGHYGEVFNYKHRSELEAHPDFLAWQNNRRVPWNASAKWCISNASFRQFFIADRIEELKQQLKVSAPNEKVVLSVDPADGSGDCECSSCKKLGSVSDRYFFLANETAKALAKVSSRAYANIYAYNTHASPPAFSLVDNLIVQIIPYAFQNIGTPQQFIDAWHKRHQSLLLYDYYCIPDWYYDVPSPRKTSSDTLVNRIRYWRQKGITGFQLETTYSTGLAGLGLYQAARLGWDVKSNIQEVNHTFFQQMFGAVAGEINHFSEFLKTDFVDATSLPYLRKLLSSAKKKANAKEMKRLTQLEAYVHYLTLFFQYNSANDNLGKSWENLIQYVWEIYPLQVIHSTRIADLLLSKVQAGDPLLNDWNITIPYGKKLQKVHFANDGQIEKLTSADSQRSPFLEGFPYTRRKKQSYVQKPLKNNSGIEEERLILGVNFPKTFVMASSSGNVNFSIRMQDSIDSPISIKMIDTATGAEVYTKRLQLRDQYISFSIPASKNRIYQLVMEYRPWLLLKIPHQQWLAFAEVPTYSVMGTLWFFVPAGNQYLYFSNTAKEQPDFRNEEGKLVPAEKVYAQGLYRLKIKPGGEWWSIQSSQYKNLTFYSVPDLFFPYPNYTANP